MFLAKKIVNRSVSFNVLDPVQKELLEFINNTTTNFSGWMKMLIAEKKNGSVPMQAHVEEKVFMEGLI